MTWMLLSWLALLVYLLLSKRKTNQEITRLIENVGSFEGVKGVKAVINAERFEESLQVRIKRVVREFTQLLNPNPILKLLMFFLISAIAVYFINDFFLQQTYWKVLLFLQPLLFVVFIVKLRAHKTAKFQSNFPDALNILSGALSAGQSIVHAFEYVGKQLDNDVGYEFKFMAARLLIGEDPDEVLARSAASFPYVEYFFFASTIRINLSRGGQLKEVINRINRIMFDARAVDKKKNALTSEARSSAKIIAALPVIFLLILKFTSPENFNFVMFEEGGKPIFYYVVISELIGFFCIWMILRGVD
ncbi:type II secretion system F family protein [Vibrio mimicus]|uniref:type II secretion system F family protein n=1 Tax=Vibrio mimicus TaxID=674 RepID=UPI00076B393C|nr:type II secretion system F family protein [Vibrio mimicus]AMG02135.1 pilus assembly protein TadB [Vibrio mimicus]